MLSGQLTEQGIAIPENVGIGLAVALDSGLVAPMVHEVTTMTLSQIAAKTADLVSRARVNKLLPDELTGGCITISNLGMMGVDRFCPIVIPGQTSIIGVGRIKEMPFVDQGELRLEKTMSLTISADHRVVDGAYAARFITAIKRELEDPQGLFH